MKKESRQSIRRKKREKAKQLRKELNFKKTIDGRNYFEGHISWGTYMELFQAGIINNHGSYQRPYKYKDFVPGYYGNEWQKNLIGNTLLKDKIPTISLREIDKEFDFNLGGFKTLYGSEILDGGHRTKTWYHFFIGELHTPEGFELEINGKVYGEEEVGGCSWLDFPTEVKDYLSKNIVVSLDVFYNMSDDEAGKKFRTLNNLHTMTDQEKRNSYRTQISKYVRKLGSTDSDEFDIFNTLTSNESNFKYLGGNGLKVHGRNSDELVAKIVYILENGTFDNCGKKSFEELIPTKGQLTKMYEEDLHEDSTEKGTYHEKSKLMKRVKDILSIINDIIILNSDKKYFNNSHWTVSSLIKLSIYLNRWIDKWGLQSMLRMDKELFYSKLVGLFENEKLLCTEKYRYHIKNGKVVPYFKSDKHLPGKYPFKKQWTNSKRIDDVEWVLLNIELDMEKSLSNWGIIELDPKRWFDGDQKKVIEKRDGKVCNVDGCNETHGLEVDHKEPWSKGGRTTVENGQLLCKTHNTTKSDTVSDEDLLKLSEIDLTNWLQMGKLDNDKFMEILKQKMEINMG